jgi:ankyrin repeat protein
METLQANDAENVLLRALASSNFEQAKELLEEHVEWDINQVKDKYLGIRPLHFAAREGHITITKYWVTVKSADVNVTDNVGMTPLMYAAMFGHLMVCEFLLETNADVNQQDKRGRTALLLAAGKGHFNVCQLLEAKGADVNVQDNQGKTALLLAAEKGYLAVCQLLGDRCKDLNTKDYRRETALLCAARNNRLDVCEYLIKRGANLNEKNINGKTALVYVCNYGNYDLLKRSCLAGAITPSPREIDFRAIQLEEPLKTKNTAAIRTFVTKQPLRQTIFFIMCANAVRRMATQSPIKLLNVDLIRELFITLGDA